MAIYSLFKNTVVKKTVSQAPSASNEDTPPTSNIPDQFLVTVNLQELTACLVSLHAIATLIEGRQHERLMVAGLHQEAQEFLSIPALKLYDIDASDMQLLYGSLIDKLWEQLSVDDWESL